MTLYRSLNQPWRMALCLAGALSVLCAFPANARQTASSTNLPATTSSDTSAPAVLRADDIRARETLFQQQETGSRPAPFGSELFLSGGVQSSGVSAAGYIMQPGDRVGISLSGLINEVVDATVDPNGNIIVPGVGPVPIAGLPAESVNAAVSSAASKVYRDGVRIYATPISASSINVFVTGGVEQPGPQSGGPRDSIIAYLQRAKGIDAERGSYRNVIVRRGGATIARADLYAFLRAGEMPDINLRMGDVIVVGEQGSIVSVSGDARAAYTFELLNTTGAGAELLDYARPRPETTHVEVLGVRNAVPFNVYMTLGEFAQFQLADGDRVRFARDRRPDTILVQVEGAHTGPSAYTVSRYANLADVLAQIPLDTLAQADAIHLRRSSVAQTQKLLLDESLARLERQLYTTPSGSSSVAAARAVEAAAVQQFIERARRVQPLGVVALPDGANLQEVTLEPNDVIVVPYRSQVIAIGGEVAQPQSLIFQQGLKASDYVERAGGFADRADRRSVLVIHPDGTTERNGTVRPGDRILVLSRVSSRNLELLRDWTQVIYQVAVAAAVL